MAVTGVSGFGKQQRNERNRGYSKMIKDAKRDRHIKAFVVVGALTVILMAVALYVYMNSSQKKIDSDNQTYLQDNTTRIAESIDDATDQRIPEYQNPEHHAQ